MLSSSNVTCATPVLLPLAGSKRMRREEILPKSVSSASSSASRAHHVSPLTNTTAPVALSGTGSGSVAGAAAA